MSVDTYLYIDKKFQVWMCTASCVCEHLPKRHCLKCQKSSIIAKGKSLEDAMKKADKYWKNNPCDVEYGINLSLWCK